jgi:hypothetical protein
MKTWNISANSKHGSSCGEIISELPLPKQGGTFRIISNIFHLLQAVNALFEDNWPLSY